MLKRLCILSAFLLAPTTAFAHSGHDLGQSFAAGFMHPVMGADHVLAILTVGLWAALCGKPQLWLWPASFVSAMIAGFFIAHSGFALPFVEPMILGSVIGLGILVALALRPHPVLGAKLMALFGLFHGFAHGTEAGGSMLAGFGGGFVLATIALHGAGMLLAFLLARLGQITGRLAGLFAALGGLALAIGG
jgi:urease accessory protein